MSKCIGQSLREPFGADLAAEQHVRTLEIEARDQCECVKDHVTKARSRAPVADEEGHIDFLETQVDLFDHLGEATSGLLLAKPANAAD